MKRALCGVAAVLALGGAIGPAAAFACAGGGKGPEPRFTFCHATGSADNPYVKVTTARVAYFKAHMENHDDVLLVNGACPTTLGGGGGGGGGGEL